MMLTRNDTCFFALAFYRQTIGEIFRCRDERHIPGLVRQATYWWECYLERRAANRLILRNPTVKEYAMNMNQMYSPGDIVSTPLGKGSVVWVRMGGAHYHLVQAVSVLLDSKKNTPNYSGTVFPAADVKSINNETK